jgi:hypothetical protein
MIQKYYITQKSTQALLFLITTTSIVDGAEVENTFDLSGYDFIFILKRKEADPDTEALITKTVAIDAAERTALVELSPTDTDIPPGTYFLGTRYHLDGTHSTDGQSYTIEVRRAGTEVPT